MACASIVRPCLGPKERTASSQVLVMNWKSPSADDVEALFQELKASGADIIEGPTRRIYDCVEMEVRDCNGFKLVFSQG